MPPKKIPKPAPGQQKLTFVSTPRPSTSASEGGGDNDKSTAQQGGEVSDEGGGKRKFQGKWLSLYPWLRHDSQHGVMFCAPCRALAKKNALASGTDNFRTSTITRHILGSDHQFAISAKPESENMTQSTKKALDKKEEAVIVAFKGIFWLCQENLPLNKFRSLMKLFTHLKVPCVEHLQCKDRVDYTSDSSADELLQVLSDIIDSNITDEIQKSPAITVFADESTDIVVHHKLAINVRVVDPLSLSPRTYFLTDVRLHDGSGKGIFDAIKAEFEKRKLPLSKVYGLGTDGAAVMTGSKKGLMGHFLTVNPHIHNTHCSAHRVALVSEQAADQVKAIQDFRDTVRSIFYYFHRSPAKVDAVEAVQKVLDEPVLKYREVHAIRWLSFFNALDSIYRTLDSLLTLFESRKGTDPKAAGLCKKVGQAMFISIAYAMMDWLQPVMALSQFFQKKDIDISIVKVNVLSCISDLEQMRDNENPLDKPRYFDTLSADLQDGDFKGHTVARNSANFETVKNSFLQAMINNLRQRFPDTEKMAMFSIFGMKPVQFLTDKDLETWGDVEMKEIATFYTSTQSHKDPDGVVHVSQPYLECQTSDILQEWKRCKSIVKTNRYPTRSLTTLWQCLADLQQDGSLDCPNLIQLACLVLTHPVHSCDCERTFSVQNLTITPLRNRLSSVKCDQMMRVRIEGGDMDSFDFAKAVDKWSKKAKYRAIFSQH